jgi:hypothetical protein
MNSHRILIVDNGPEFADFVRRGAEAGRPDLQQGHEQTELLLGVRETDDHS